MRNTQLEQSELLRRRFTLSFYFNVKKQKKKTKTRKKNNKTKKTEKKEKQKQRKKRKKTGKNLTRKRIN